MLDLENIRNYLKHEQKRADDAVEQIKKLNEEVNYKMSTKLQLYYETLVDIAILISIFLIFQLSDKFTF